jgi:hypothetical protein
VTTAQELTAIQLAIQTLTATGQSQVSLSIDGVAVTYNASQLVQLGQREEVLLRRLSIRNVRKRTQSDFSETGGSPYYQP